LSLNFERIQKACALLTVVPFSSTFKGTVREVYLSDSFIKNTRTLKAKNKITISFLSVKIIDVRFLDLIVTCGIIQQSK